MFFLDFGTTKVKRLSFSSSFGIKDWNHPEHVDFVKSALNQFSFVTCREDSGMKLLRDVLALKQRPYLTRHYYLIPMMNSCLIVKLGKHWCTIR